ncbi:hypothetical protein ACFL40_03900 [candidate division KSB1 bacterium]
MNKCPHKKVVFAGFQETLEPGKSIMLYRCLLCGSTITLGKKSKAIIKPERDPVFSTK